MKWIILSLGQLSIFLSSHAQNTQPATGANIVGGSSAGIRTLPSITAELNNVRANQWIQSYEKFSSQNPGSPVVESAKATVQLIPKCSIGKRSESSYYIGQFTPLPFCSGTNTNHPLANSGSPTSRNRERPNENLPTYDGSPPCGKSTCSGFLVGDQQTIGTAGHCLQQKNPADFCKEYVIVFNRTGNKTEFSHNDIFECESGKSVDTVQGQNINFTSDGSGFKDHAFLRLKKPVPATTAAALQLSTTTPTRGDTLYAIGHPDGNPRMVSPINYTVSPNRNGYNYLQGVGYVYQGNSGGPLLDGQGRVAGILSSVDDKEFGKPNRRQPKVRVEGTESVCRTQIATNSPVSEAVGFSREVREDLESLISTNTPPETGGDVEQ